MGSFPAPRKSCVAVAQYDSEDNYPRLEQKPFAITPSLSGSGSNGKVDFRTEELLPVRKSGVARVSPDHTGASR